MYFSHVVLRDFYKNPWISLYCKFCLWTLQHIFAVSADVSRVCDVVYEEERSWSGVNRTELKMYGAKPYQFEPTYLYLYPLREGPVQKEERNYSSSILRHISSKNIRWHPNSVPRCWDPDLLTNNVLNHEAQNAKKYVWNLILHTFKIYLKIHHFLGTILL